MAITASLVKDLRERTGAGMMECKKALVETQGDIEAAIELMRKSGMANADKKAGRIAAEGVIAVSLDAAGKTAAMVEINSETDFVAKGDDFISFVSSVSQLALLQQPPTTEALLELPDTKTEMTINAMRKVLVAKIGENITVRRLHCLATATGLISTYLHGTKIGVLVNIEGGDESLGRDIAMHIAASHPDYLMADDVDQAELDKEKAIFVAQAKDSGKPDAIIEKMTTGRLKKFVNEITLYGQAFVKNSDITIEQLLTEANAKVIGFQRFEVGEGIEKKAENFADEVRAQVQQGR